MAAGYRSLLGFWAGGGASVAPTTQAGYSSLLGFWAGGAAPATPTATQAGYSSLLGFWAGGAAPAPPTVTQAGYKSLLGFWAGGGVLGEVIPDETQDVGGRLRLHRIRDEYPPTPSVVCQAVVVPITARVRQPDPLPLLDALDGGLFGGTAFAAAPIRSVRYRTQLPSVAAVAAVGVLSARAGARLTIDGASVTSVISACVARAGARMQMAGVESELQLGDFDDVYAQIDITDDDLATIIAGVVDAL